MAWVSLHCLRAVKGIEGGLGDICSWCGGFKDRNLRRSLKEFRNVERENEARVVWFNNVIFVEARSSQEKLTRRHSKPTHINK